LSRCSRRPRPLLLLSERPSRSFRFSAKLRDRRWRRLLPLQVHREVHAGETRVRSSKCIRSGGVRCCVATSRARRVETPLLGRKRERRGEKDIVISHPVWIEVPKVHVYKGGQTKKSTPKLGSLSRRVGPILIMIAKTVNPQGCISGCCFIRNVAAFMNSCGSDMFGESNSLTK